MGTFVSDSVSPFFRRRKGRIGIDKWIEMGQPPFAGARISSAAGNEVCLICAPNDSNSYARSEDGGKTWSTFTLPIDTKLGRTQDAGNKLVVRPFDAEMDFENWNLQRSFTGVGTTIVPVASTRGAGIRIDFFGKSSAVVWTLAAGQGAMESISWHPDGKFFCAFGQDSADVIQVRGKNFEAPDSGSIGGTGVSDDSMLASHPLLNHPRTKYQFLSSDITRIIRLVTVTVGVAGVQSNPINPRNIVKFFQLRNVILGVSSTAGLDNVGIRSVDTGLTWQRMDSTGKNSPFYDIWRYGRWIYICGRDAPNRIMRSKDFGKTWENHPTQLPNGLAKPSIVCDQNGQFYLFTDDGVTNRCYRFIKHGEI